MKRVIFVILVLYLFIIHSGVCYAAAKIAIVTNTISMNEEEYLSAEEMVDKYGADRIVHYLWPYNFMSEQGKTEMIVLLIKIASNPDIKALIINQAVQGTNAAVDKLLEIRNDVFIVYINPQEEIQETSKRAHVILQPNHPELGYKIADQAGKMGAKTLVHYSFPRHMSSPIFSIKKNNMKQKCDELGIKFVDAMTPDPVGVGDSGIQKTVLFILEDVPKMVARYGTKTAFFGTSCAMQSPLIIAVLRARAIFPIPCCPSPFHGFPVALKLENEYTNTGDADRMERTSENAKLIIDESRRIISMLGASGKLSNWPVPFIMMATTGATEYAMMVIDGKASPSKPDKRLLEEFFSDYAGVNIVMTNVFEGVFYPNFFLTLLDFITY